MLLSCIVAIALAAPSLQLQQTDPLAKATKNSAFSQASGWLLLLDLSKSMTLTDVLPNRLAAMRETAFKLIQQAGARPVGLIIYAGDAFLIAPPAIDKNFLKEKLAVLEAGLIDTEGSNATRALALAASVLQSSGLLEARVFLLNDGGGMSSRTSPALASLASGNHRTDIIVFGKDAPAGEPSWNHEDMNKLAKAGRGKQIQSDALGNVDLDLLDLKQAGSKSTLVSRGAISLISQTNHSHWLLLLALPLFLLPFFRNRH